MQIPEPDFPTAEQRHIFFSSVLEDIAALPGVVSVSAASKLPIQSRSTDWPVWRADRPAPPQNEAFSPLARWVYPRYFETMGIPLRRGRDISTKDATGTPKVVVISESTARALYQDEDPIGRPLVIWGQFDTAPLDPAAYAAAFALLALVAAAACLVPAWRATRIDPVEVLRGQ